MGKVRNRIQQSIVFRIGTLMLLTVVLSIGSMLASYLISDSAGNDAALVNLSGSLRAMTYKLVAAAETPDPKVTETLAREISARIDRIARITESSTREDTAARHLHDVQRQWQKLQPLAVSVANGTLDARRQLLAGRADSFAERLNALVVQYQHDAEKRIDRLRLVQIGALFATVTLIYFSLFFLSRSVEQPLRRLIDSCRNIARGNFNQKPESYADNELGVLARTISHMCQVIHNTNQELETRVRNKTAELRHSHAVLDFQYRLARRISQGPLEHGEIRQWMVEFSRLTGLDNLDLCLMTREGTTPYEHLIQGNGNHVCMESDCGNCAHARGLGEVEEQRIHRFSLEADRRNYGVLVCTLASGHPLEREQEQRLSAFADAVTTAITLKERGEAERRAVLMDERGVIARELHDSLAQSLSYLKIQVARLGRCDLGTSQSSGQVAEITAELKQGLNASYRQLRELLTTFRLQMADDGLRPTLEQSAAHYQVHHPEIDVQLVYQLEEIPLTPNEEIHLLQLIREASQNAVYHSQGDHILISLVPSERGEVYISVTDNGVGINDSPEKRNHFGMSIMQERASKLGGQLDIRRRRSGGTRVSFRFTPEYARERELLWQQKVPAEC